MLSIFRRLGPRILLATSSILVSLLLAEALLRATRWNSYLYSEFRLKGHKINYLPGQSQRWKHLEWDVQYKINSKGFRDEEYAPQTGTRGIVVLGDSFAEGYGIDLKDTFGKKLQETLQRRGCRYHVYNAGIRGFALLNYVAVYHDCFKNSSDVSTVIMAFLPCSDIESGPHSPYVQGPDRSALAYKLKIFLVEHSVLYNLFRIRVKRSARLIRLFSNMGLMYFGEPLEMNQCYNMSVSPAWKFSADYINKFAADLKRSGREFLLLLVPLKEQVDDDSYEQILERTKSDRSKIDRFAFNRFMGEYCRQKHLHCLDLTPRFREAWKKTRAQYYFQTDGHWNKAGHALAANTILSYLLRKGSLKPSCATTHVSK